MRLSRPRRAPRPSSGTWATRLEALERRHLLAAHGAATTDLEIGVRAAALPAALEDTFVLHSRPEATKRIYLDFNGHVTTGTAWQAGATFTTPAYSLDGNLGGFSDIERAEIQHIWAHVVEDFSPFDVDVTTEEPALDDLRNTGAGDARWGIRVVIGGDGSWSDGATGAAYLNSFTWSDDTPCFVFTGQEWGANRDLVANRISHQVGRTLGLAPDGYQDEEYYVGRGTGETSWGPIMGDPESVTLTQWSRGEYAGATNTAQDDLSVITSRNGFGYRLDDHGSLPASATPIAPGTTGFSGVIERDTDVDVFRFETSGRIRLTISPNASGPNLDILATLLDAAGNTIATSNPVAGLGASFDLTVAAGTYDVTIRGTGMGDVATTGYTAYGSLGQYTATLDVSPPLMSTLAVQALGTDKAEGSSLGVTPFTFVVTRSGGAAVAASVAWAVTGSGGSAAGPNDFLGGATPLGRLEFAAGETSKTITVNVVADTTPEDDEGFLITLSSAVNATIVTATALGTIRDDDTPATPPRLSVTAVDADKNEGDSGSTQFTFSVTRSGDTSEASVATWTVAGSGPQPAAATDFAGGVAPSGVVSFAAGQTTQAITVDVGGDLLVENDESFEVKLTAAVNAVVRIATATGTIRNDDESTGPPVLAIQASAADRFEGSSGSTAFTFTVTRSGDVREVSSVSWLVAGRGTNPATATDFVGGVLPSGSISFAAGETSKAITVAVRGDTSAEPDEGFDLLLSAAAGAVIGVSAAPGTIRNDDAPDEASSVSITATSAFRPEGNAGITSFTFTVRCIGVPAAGASVAWFVAGAGMTAADAADFSGGVLPAGTVTFAQGQSVRTITVAVVGDTNIESNEHFQVTLIDPVGVRLGIATATGTIVNDDRAPLLPALSVTPALANRPEGDVGTTPFTFQVVRSGPATVPVSVRWRASGSGAVPADATDFVGGALPVGELAFAAGEKIKVITVTVAADQTVEPDEIFAVTLSDPVGAVVGQASALATIRNDDRTAGVTSVRLATAAIARAEGRSGSTPFMFQVVRAGLLTGTSTVHWSVAGRGPAGTAPNDFVGGQFPTGSLTFGPGESTKWITVNVAGDALREPDEQFTLTIVEAAGATLGTASGVGTVRNDDGRASSRSTDERLTAFAMLAAPDGAAFAPSRTGRLVRGR